MAGKDARTVVRTAATFSVEFLRTDLIAAPGQTLPALIGAFSLFLPWFPIVLAPLRGKYAYNIRKEPCGKKPLSGSLRTRRAVRPTAPLFETAVSWGASFAAPARDRAVSASLARNRAMCAARLKDARTWKQKYPPFRSESAKDAPGSHLNALRLRQR
jgi:hypothetical protein